MSPTQGAGAVRERTIMGLLRLIGWQSGRDRELTAEEAEMILEVAATQPVSDDDHARLRERVLNQLAAVTKPSGEFARLADETAEMMASWGDSIEDRWSIARKIVANVQAVTKPEDGPSDEQIARVLDEACIEWQLQQRSGALKWPGGFTDWLQFVPLIRALFAAPLQQPAASGDVELVMRLRHACTLLDDYDAEKHLTIFGALEAAAARLSAGQPQQGGDEPRDEEVWAILFEDPDVRPEVFMGSGARDAAMFRYREALQAWSCSLFRAATPAPDSGLQEDNDNLAEVNDRLAGKVQRWAERWQALREWLRVENKFVASNAYNRGYKDALGNVLSQIDAAEQEGAER